MGLTDGSHFGNKLHRTASSAKTLVPNLIAVFIEPTLLSPLRSYQHSRLMTTLAILD